MKLSYRNKLAVLLIYLLSLSLILVIFHFRRIAGINKTTVELNRVRGEIAAIQNILTETDNFKNRSLSKPQTLAYVEFLYRTADENRLKLHEVVTDNSQSTAGIGAAFTSSRLKITVKGDFRSVAEYIRTILNQQQFTRITELKITADQNSVIGNINIELFSFK